MNWIRSPKMEALSNLWLYYLFCGTLFVMPMGTSPYTILGLCVLFVWLFSAEFIRKRNQYLHSEWLLPVLTIVVLTWLGLLWSPEPFGLGLKYAKKTHYWLYTFAVSGVLIFADHRDRLDTLINAFLLGLLLNTVVGFMQFMGFFPRISQWGATGYTGLYGSYNTLAILLVLGMMISSFYFKNEVIKRHRVKYLFFVMAFFFHLIILEGRGGYLTLIILLPVIIYNLLNGKKTVLMVFVYLALVGFMISSPIVKNRMSRTIGEIEYLINAEDEISSGKKYSEQIDRLYMWRWAIEIVKENPFFGVGTGGYKKAILLAGAEKGVDHPHNNVLYVAASFGIVGLLAFCWLFWCLLKTGWKNRHSSPGFFIMASTLVVIVGGLTDTQILDSGGAFLLAITTGFMTLFSKRLPENSGKT